LFVRTLVNLQRLPSGFNQENVMLFTIDPSATGYKDDDPRLVAVMHEVEQKARAVPGVQAAAFSFFVFNQGVWTNPVFIVGQNSSDPQTRFIRNNVVGDDFFIAMGIPLVQGRGFGPGDTSKAPKVAVISESMAQRFFPNISPIGQRFGINGPESSNQIEIVGMVKDAKYGNLTEQFKPMAYYPIAQRPSPFGNFVVRFSGSAAAVVPQLREVIRQVNHNLPVDEVVSLTEFIDRSLVQQKLVARLASFFGLLALLLACVGLYGVMSYAVARRTNEIGIRMALGAQSRSVLWLVFREALILVAIGLVIGLLVSLATTKTAATLLFGLKPNDPLTIALATLVLTGVASLASYLPARRAARVDPIEALRDE
jgi:predicted permease